MKLDFRGLIAITRLTPLKLMLGWAVLVVTSYLSWVLFLHLGPFEGNVNVVCGYFSAVCGAYIVFGLITAGFIDRYLRERERK